MSASSARGAYHKLLTRQVRRTSAAEASPQLALGVGQLAGDLLGVALVVPQVGIGRLVFELLDLGAQAVHVEHPLHRGQGGVKGGDVRLSIEVHGSSGYRRRGAL